MVEINPLWIRKPRQFSGKRKVFSTNGAGTADYPCAKELSVDPYLIPYTEIN